MIKGASEVMLVDRHPDRLALVAKIGCIPKQGQIAFDVRLYFQKGLRMGCGQADVKRYNRQLRDLIHAGRAKPSFLVSHRLKLDEAPNAYKHFDRRDKGWTKVILRLAA